MIAIMSDTLETLFGMAERRRIDAGHRLFQSGDPVTHMFFVGSGAIDLTRMTEAGTLIVLHRARAGTVLAEASAYSTVYHCDAQALSDTTVRAVTTGEFKTRLAASRPLAESWAAHLAHAVQGARLRAEIRTLRTVAERLDTWMGDGGHLPAKGTWQDVAAELGVSREALYRELAKRRLSRG